ncbi:hypothetical protein FN846DRAFT_910311 [Sphaerosporella brunnea]|uniref:HNH nuclease domain-containing protein n=1 Tax=Sphaerosporella brunnea TaxID=1250544 RepID=A0A5J5ENT9_9PEZI|nr:hypothetical protein FN846DRAFT_910311 [Sphaerosporella brunnea]
MAAFIRRSFQGLSAADAAGVTPTADAPDDAAIVTAAADGETSQATGQSGDIKKHKCKPNRKRKAKHKAIHQEKKTENDQPCNIPKVTGETAITPGLVSVSAVFAKNWIHLRRCVKVSEINPTTDVRNVVSMRPDLLMSFDDGDFVLVPKEGEFCIHFLKPTFEFGPLFHNRIVSALADDVAVPFLYARFAWAIFPEQDDENDQPRSASNGLCETRR